MADWTSTEDVRRLPAVGEAADPAFWRDYGVGDEYVQRWHNVGSALGVAAFGINACTGDPGDVLMVEHDEVEYGGQEEVYLVLAGRARFTLDGEDVDLGPGGAASLRGPRAPRRGRAGAGDHGRRRGRLPRPGLRRGELTAQRPRGGRSSAPPARSHEARRVGPWST